jgi:hypothetical protein
MLIILVASSGLQWRKVAEILLLFTLSPDAATKSCKMAQTKARSLGEGWQNNTTLDTPGMGHR